MRAVVDGEVVWNVVGTVAVGMTFSVTLGVAFVWVGRLVGVCVCRVSESLRRN